MEEDKINKLDEIIKQVTTEEITECEAIDDIILLFSDKPRYSVSLVYVKNIYNGQEICLRLFITYANSEEEALGKAITELDEKMKGYNLSNKLVMKHN